MKLQAILVAAFLVCSMGLVAHAGEVGSADHGKKLFNDPHFAGGSRSCNSCHPDGQGLDHAASKTHFSIMGGSQNSLEEAVNACIVGASKGKAIPTDSQEMKDIVAYIKSVAR
jgi:cytochrome c